MEFLIWLALGIIGAIVTLGGNMLSNDLYDRCPALARWLIKLAVQRLPFSQRERYAEEWLAHSMECRGNLGKVLHAAECWICAGSLAKIRSFDLATLEVKLEAIGEDGQAITSKDIILDGWSYLIFLELYTRRCGPLPEGMDSVRKYLLLNVDRGGMPDPEQFRILSYSMDSISDVPNSKGFRIVARVVD